MTCHNYLNIKKSIKRILVPLSRLAEVAAKRRAPGGDTPCGCRERAGERETDRSEVQKSVGFEKT